MGMVPAQAFANPADGAPSDGASDALVEGASLGDVLASGSLPVPVEADLSAAGLDPQREDASALNGHAAAEFAGGALVSEADLEKLVPGADEASGSPEVSGDAGAVESNPADEAALEDGLAPEASNNLADGEQPAAGADAANDAEASVQEVPSASETAPADGLPAADTAADSSNTADAAGAPADPASADAPGAPADPLSSFLDLVGPEEAQATELFTPLVSATAETAEAERALMSAALADPSSYQGAWLYDTASGEKVLDADGKPVRVVAADSRAEGEVRYVAAGSSEVRLLGADRVIVVEYGKVAEIGAEGDGGDEAQEPADTADADTEGGESADSPAEDGPQTFALDSNAAVGQVTGVKWEVDGVIQQNPATITFKGGDISQESAAINGKPNYSFLAAYVVLNGIRHEIDYLGTAQIGSGQKTVYALKDGTGSTDSTTIVTYANAGDQFVFTYENTLESHKVSLNTKNYESMVDSALRTVQFIDVPSEVKPGQYFTFQVFFPNDKVNLHWEASTNKYYTNLQAAPKTVLKTTIEGGVLRTYGATAAENIPSGAVVALNPRLSYIAEDFSSVDSYVYHTITMTGVNEQSPLWINAGYKDKWGFVFDADKTLKGVFEAKNSSGNSLVGSANNNSVWQTATTVNGAYAGAPSKAGVRSISGSAVSSIESSNKTEFTLQVRASGFCNHATSSWHYVMGSIRVNGENVSYINSDRLNNGSTASATTTFRSGDMTGLKVTVTTNRQHGSAGLGADTNYNNNNPFTYYDIKFENVYTDLDIDINMVQGGAWWQNNANPTGAFTVSSHEGMDVQVFKGQQGQYGQENLWEDVDSRNVWRLSDFLKTPTTVIRYKPAEGYMFSNAEYATYGKNLGPDGLNVVKIEGIDEGNGQKNGTRGFSTIQGTTSQGWVIAQMAANMGAGLKGGQVNVLNIDAAKMVKPATYKVTYEGQYTDSSGTNWWGYWRSGDPEGYLPKSPEDNDTYGIGSIANPVIPVSTLLPNPTKRLVEAGKAPVYFQGWEVKNVVSAEAGSGLTYGTPPGGSSPTYYVLPGGSIDLSRVTFDSKVADVINGKIILDALYTETAGTGSTVQKKVNVYRHSEGKTGFGNDAYAVVEEWVTTAVGATVDLTFVNQTIAEGDDTFVMNMDSGKTGIVAGQNPIKDGNDPIANIYYEKVAAIAYDKGSASGVTGNAPADQGRWAYDTVTLDSGNGLSRAGYTLAGWSTTQNLPAGDFNPTNNPTRDYALGQVGVQVPWDGMTLYPVWKSSVKGAKFNFGTNWYYQGNPNQQVDQLNGGAKYRYDITNAGATTLAAALGMTDLPRQANEDELPGSFTNTNIDELMNKHLFDVKLGSGANDAGTNENNYFEGWYTGVGGTGTRVTKDTDLSTLSPNGNGYIQLYAKWGSRTFAAGAVSGADDKSLSTGYQGGSADGNLSGDALANSGQWNISIPITRSGAGSTDAASASAVSWPRITSYSLNPSNDNFALYAPNGDELLKDGKALAWQHTSGANGEMEFSAVLKDGLTPGEYSTAIQVKIDLGPTAGGWHRFQTVSIPLKATVTGDLDIKTPTIDYETEEITFTGADVAGTTVTGDNFNHTVKNDGDKASLASALDAWPAGDQSTELTLEKTQEFYRPHTSTISVPHRPQAPEATVASTVGSDQATLSINSPRDGFSYQYIKCDSNGTEAAGAQWTDMGTASAGGAVQASVDAGAYYKVRIKGSNANSNFASEPSAVYKATHEVMVTLSHANDHGKDMSSLVKAGIEADGTLGGWDAWTGEKVHEVGSYLQTGSIWSKATALVPGYKLKSISYAGTEHTSGNIQITAAGPVTFNWVKISQTVTFDYKGAQVENQGNSSLLGEKAAFSHPDGWAQDDGSTVRDDRHPDPKKNGANLDAFDFYRDGQAFAGWWTKDGTDTGDWGEQYTKDTKVYDLVKLAPETDLTVYAKWVDVDYSITGSRVENGDTDTSLAVGYKDDGIYDMEVNLTGTQSGGEGGIAPDLRVLGVSAEAVGANSDAFKVTVTSGDSGDFDTALGHGVGLQVAPADGQGALAVGEYQIKLKVSYDGGSQYGLDLGTNVKDGSENAGNPAYYVTVTLKVEKLPVSDLDVKFGPIDYENERIQIVGTHVPATVDMAKEHLEIAGADAATANVNWDDCWVVEDGKLYLNLSRALDSDQGNWAGDGSALELTLNHKVCDTHEAGTLDTAAFNGRGNAPGLVADSYYEEGGQQRVPAFGEGASGTVRIDTAGMDPAETVLLQHSMVEGGVSAWHSLNGATSFAHAADADNPYGVRVRWKADSAADAHDGWFASRVNNVWIDQWYKVEYKLLYTDLEGAQQDGNAVAGKLNADGTVTARSTFYGEVNGAAANVAEREKFYVRAGAKETLPVFGKGDGTWETPGFDIVKIEQGVLSPGTSATPGVIEDQKDQVYGATQSNDITGDTLITYTLEPKTLTVRWNISNASTQDPYPNDLPSTQKVSWLETVHTSMLASSGADKWDPDNATWVNKYFDSATLGDDGKPIDPVSVNWPGYMRDPWQLWANDANVDSFHPFQVGQTLSHVWNVSPAEYGQNAQGTAATSWRDVEGLTFGVQYRTSTGQYGVVFNVPNDIDGVTLVNGNSADSRLSKVTAEGKVDSQVKIDGTDVSLNAPGVLKDGNGEAIVFSGFLFDEPGKSGAQPALGNYHNEKWQFDTAGGGAGQKSIWDHAKTVEENVHNAYVDTWNVKTENGDKVGPMDGTARPVPYGPDSDSSYSDSAELPDYAKFSLAARFEDARLADAPLSAAFEEGQIGGISLPLTARDFFDPADGGRNSVGDKPSFSDFSATVANTSTGIDSSVANDWLSAGALSGQITDDGAKVDLPLTVKSDLKPGRYTAEVTVTYRYTDSFGRRHDGLTKTYTVTVDVTSDGQTAEEGDYTATVHDYATMRANAAAELGDAASLAQKMGLSVMVENADGTVSAVSQGTGNGQYTFTATPSSIGQDDESPIEVSYVVTVKDGTGATHTLNVRANVHLYDTGVEQNGVKVFANNAQTTLPEKDKEALGSNYTAWALALVGGAAYDVNNNYQPLTVTIGADDGLREANPDTVGTQVQTHVKVTGADVSAKPNVTINKATIAAPSAPVQDASAYAVDAVTWEAATHGNDFSVAQIDQPAGNAWKVDYAPQMEYAVDGNEGAPVSGLTQNGLSPNTSHQVKARFAASKVYDVDAAGWSAEATMWTKPSAPAEGAANGQPTYTYDYAAETVTAPQTYAENGNDVTLELDLSNPTAAGGTITASVADLAGTKEGAYKGATQPGVQSGTFTATATGKASTLESDQAVISTVPQRAAKPDLVYAPPILQADKGTFTGWDAAYVKNAANPTEGTEYETFYQVSKVDDADAGARTWEPVKLAYQGGEWTYQVDPGSTYVFQVTHSDGAWFKSAESDQYRVVAGAYIVANDFSIAKTAIEKYYDEANGSYTLKADDASRNEFETNLKNWAAAGVMPSGSGMTVKVDFDTAFGAVPVEGAYEVTFYLQDTAGQKVTGSEKKVTMAVTSSGDPSVNPQAKLFASNFAVGKDEIGDSWTGMAEMNQLAWDRSNAHGTKKNGAEELALADVEVTIAPAGGSAQAVTDPAAIERGSYRVTFRYQPLTADGQNDGTAVTATVTMTVYDHMGASDGFLVASNDFTAGADELVWDDTPGASNSGFLSDAEAVKRASATLYAADNAAVALPSDGLAVDLTALRNALGRTTVTDGAVFTAKNDTAAQKASAASDVLVTDDSAVSTDYSLNGNDFFISLEELQGKKLLPTGSGTPTAQYNTQLIYNRGQVMPVNLGTGGTLPFNQLYYTVVTPAGESLTNKDSGTLNGHTGWTTGDYQVTIAVQAQESTSIQVTMHVYDNGQTVIDPDGNGYFAIYSNNVHVKEGADLAELVKPDSDYENLRNAAQVAAYFQEFNGTHRPYGGSDVATGTGDQLAQLAAKKAGESAPVTFLAPKTAAEAERAQSTSTVFVHGDGTSDPDGNGIWANPFAFGLNELTGEGAFASTPDALTDALKAEMYDRANVTGVLDQVGLPAAFDGAKVSVAVVGAQAGDAWAAKTYQVTFSLVADGTKSATVSLTVYPYGAKGDRYAVFSSPFKVSEDDLPSLTDEQLATLGKVTVYDADNLSAPIASGAAALDKVAVDKTGLKNGDAWKTAGDDAWVNYTANDDAAATATSQVTIWGGGAVDPGAGNQILAQDFVTSKEELAGAGDAAALKQLLFDLANVTGVKDGQAITVANISKITVNGDDEEASADNIVDGAEVTFHLDGTALKATVTATVHDKGGSHEGADGTRYGIFARDFDFSEADKNAGLLDAADNYGMLQRFAGVTATVTDADGRYTVLDGADAGNVGVNAGDVAALGALATAGASHAVTFTNAKDTENPQVTAAPLGTYRDGGQTDPGTGTLYADDFTMERGDLSGSTDLAGTFWTNANAGGFKADGTALGVNDVAVQVQKADGTWVTAADYDEGWSKNAYEVRFSYTENGKTVEAQVTLTVADDSATQGGVSISATDFNVAAAELPAAADGAEALLKWLYEQAQARAMVNGAPVSADDLANGGVSATIDGKEPTAAWPTGKGSYQVAFTVTKDADTATAVVTMTVFDNGGEVVGPDGTSYKLYSNDFTVSAEERTDSWPDDAELIKRGQVVAVPAGSTAADPNAPVAVTDRGGLATAEPGATVQVKYGLANQQSGEGCASEVYITPGGGTDPDDPDAKASIFAGDIYTSVDELAANASDVAALLYRLAGVFGTDADGNALPGAYDVGKVQVTVGEGAEAPTVSNVVDGVRVTFTVVGTKAQATVTAHVSDNGGSVVDPSTGVSYGMFSDDFDFSADDKDALAQKGAGNYADLRARANAVATKTDEHGLTYPLDGSSDAVVRVEGADGLAAAATDGQTVDVTFTNLLGTGANGATAASVSTGTYFDGGTEVVGKGSLFANDFDMERGELTGTADQIKNLFWDASGAKGADADGNALTVGDVTVSVRTGTAEDGSPIWTDLADYQGGWNASSYEVRFHYAEGVEAVVTMGVWDDVDEPADKDVSVKASGFATTVDDLAKVASADAAEWVFSQAGARATVDGTVYDAYDAAVIKVTNKGSDSLALPSEKGAYELSITATSQKDPAASATAAVTMTVFDNTSGGGDEGDVEGADYAVFSNDFEVSAQEIEAGLSNERIIQLAGATAYKKDDPHAPQGTVTVEDRTQLVAANAGTTVRVVFGVAEDGQARCASNVFITEGGGTDPVDPDNPDSGKARIAAHTVYTSKAELQANAGKVAELLYNLAGVNGTGADGAALGAYDAAKVDVKVDVDGVLEAPAADNVADGSKVTFTVVGTKAQATVTAHVSDNGGEVTDPTDPGKRYGMYSNDYVFNTADRDGALFEEGGNGYAALIERAGAFATVRGGNGYMTVLGADQVQPDAAQAEAMKQVPLGSAGDVTFANKQHAAATSASTGTHLDMSLQASDFVEKRADLQAAQGAEALRQRLWAGAQASGTDFQGTSLDVSDVAVHVKQDGAWAVVDDSFAESWDLPSYEVRFVYAKDGVGSVSAEVTLSVFDNAGEATGPDGTVYTVYSNNYTVSAEERDAGALTDEELIRRGQVVVVPQGSTVADPDIVVEVTDRTALDAAVPGDEFDVVYGIVGGTGAGCASRVYMTPGGGSDPGADASIFAQDFHTSADELAAAEAAGTLEQLLFDLAHVSGQVGGVPITADDLAGVTVGGQAATAANVTDGAQVTFVLASRSRAADLSATVTAHVSDHGGSTVDPDTGLRYGVYSRDFELGPDKREALADPTGNYAALRERAQVTAVRADERGMFHVLDASDPAVVAVSGAEGLLDLAEDGQQAALTFANVADGNAAGAVSLSTGTLRAGAPAVPEEPAAPQTPAEAPAGAPLAVEPAPTPLPLPRLGDGTAVLALLAAAALATALAARARSRARRSGHARPRR